jgi:CRP-like cAMP-binding protein
MAAGWRPITLLGRLPPAIRAEMTQLGAVREFPAGTRLMDEGSLRRDALLLLLGYVKVSVRTGTETVLLTIRGQGDLIGDMAALSGSPRSATVTACTPIVARFILPATLREFLHRRPAAAELINALIVEQLTAANRRRAEFATKPVVQRLAGVILELSVICGDRLADGSVRLPSWFPQSDLADLVGVSEDSVQRALRELRARKVIDTGYRSITIRAPEELAATNNLVQRPSAPPGMP